MVKQPTNPIATTQSAQPFGSRDDINPTSEFPYSAGLFDLLAERLANSAHGPSYIASDQGPTDIDGFMPFLDTAAAGQIDARSYSNFDYVLDCLTDVYLVMGPTQSMAAWRERQTKFVIWKSYSSNQTPISREASTCELWLV